MSEHHVSLEAEPTPIWSKLANSNEFRELVRTRRITTLVTLGAGMGSFAFWVILTVAAPGFMGMRIVSGLTVFFVFALVQIAIVSIAAMWYLRRAQRCDELAKRVRALAD